MSNPLAQEFRAHIIGVRSRLDRVSEETSRRPVRPGGWSKKEVLGHLIDSALNNHQRFVRASLDGAYTGPSYFQDGWVNAHGYGELSWTALLDHWWEQNDLLARVVERIPESRLEAECCIGDDAVVPLSFVITDYLRHMDHHVAQIVD
jgi:hypothetical protein